MSPPGPDDEEYRKMTKGEKQVYWTFVAIVAALLISLWLWKLMHAS
jgi:hypothetical protein